MTTTTTEYMTEIKFRNAVKKAGIDLANKADELYAYKTSVTIQQMFDADMNRTVSSKWSQPIWFEFSNLSVKDAARLQMAGFEVAMIEARNMFRETYTAIVYRKAA